MKGIFSQNYPVYRNERANILYFIALFTLVFIVYGFSLPVKGGPHFTPGNDFSNHANYMHHFAESFKSGQIIPRTIASPTEFSDATVPTENIPTFQYYGFFEGLVALPFQLLKIPDTICAVLSSIFIRFFGLVFLFKTCQLIGCSSRSAFLACFSLLISPYTLTVFYGRGALAETFSQSLLILIPYGYMLAYRHRRYESIIVFTLAFFLLALCHNIFFLYGFIFSSVLLLASFDQKIILPGVIGILLGVFLSAWQWYPAQQTISDIVLFGGLNSWKLGASVELNSASFNGALGIPQQWTPLGFDHSLPLYLTIGWWTLPAILLSIKCVFQPKKFKMTFPFFVCAVLFISLTFWPFNGPIFKSVVPHAFSVVQDTFRLLGFVSLLGAICFALAVPSISTRFFIGIFALMLASQIQVLMFYANLVTQKRWANNEVRRAPINYYYTKPTFNKNFGVYEEDPIKDASGAFNPNNRFYVALSSGNTFCVHLAGLVTDNKKSIKMSVVPLQKDIHSGDYEAIGIPSKEQLVSGNFSVNLKMNNSSPSGWYKIIAAPEFSVEPTGSITVNKIDIITNNGLHFITSESIKPTNKTFPYERQFKVNKSKLKEYTSDIEGLYTIELPIAYSKLFSVKQNAKFLQFYSDLNHRMLVRTNDLNNVITVNYSLDYKVIMMTWVGIAGTLIILYLNLKKSRERNAKK